MPRNPDLIFNELLVLRSQNGERDAFETLVRRWSPRLLRYCQRRTGNTEAAGEAMQTIWLRAVQGLRKLDDPARFPAWLFTIAARTCADHVRGQVRQRTLDEKIGEMPPINDEPTNDVSLDLATAIRSLPEDKRRILVLHYQEGHSVQEIARLMNIPAGTVKSRLHTLRNELRQILEGEETDEKHR